MSTKTDLVTLGWTNGDSRDIAHFQGMYNLGPALTIDGSDGPATRAALANSVARRKAGLPDISANFSAKEFRCACGGKYTDCGRIWAERKLLQACEAYRNKLVGPMIIVRGCRCPGENKRVRGAARSQHLYGRAADIEIYDISLAQIKALGVGVITGVGLYDWKGKRVPRHIDVRPVPAWQAIAGPVTWDYGDAKSAPLRPRLDLIKTHVPAIPPKPQTPSKTPSPEPPAHQEDDMPLTDGDIKKIADASASAILNSQVGSPRPTKDKPTWTLREWFKWIGIGGAVTQDTVVAQSPEKIAAAIKAALPATPEGSAVDVDELARKIVLELGKEPTA